MNLRVQCIDLNHALALLCIVNMTNVIENQQEADTLRLKSSYSAHCCRLCAT